MANHITDTLNLEARVQREALAHTGMEDAWPGVAIDRLRETVTTFANASEELRQAAGRHLDNRTSSELDGLQAKSAEHVAKWHEDAVKPLDDQIAALEARLDEAVTGAPAPSAAAVEIMLGLLPRDPLQVASLYASASPETRAVMEAAAKLVGQIPVERDGQWHWSPLLDDDTVQRFRAARLATADPTTTRTLRVLTRQRGVLKALGATAAALIRAQAR